MSIIEQLASSLGRRDEVPNQELAQQIVANGDQKAVAILVENLHHKNKDIQSDCIKTLDEIGKLNPKLVAPHIEALLALLDHKNNRLQWGAMTALNAVANENLKAVYQALPKIIACADKGSVITNDNCVGILIKLCAVPTYADDAFALLNERLLKCPTNQLPMYAENALPIINQQNKSIFVSTLTARLPEIEKDSKRLRVEKAIKKINK
ncbi:hypothetical protein VRU48_00620 [Pedobacter sp. KR3-3]|uniref:HEAT repeat domain-containing protein n=1 Tax=Pedobacter albus TaxID=3113905 RepID=A0ABU7I2A1_9SPHI|nr:hypothetical protein [Pedobacter sp. KR3-3]MEE1943589.1 hypothetical protein [Pedobacter sp. KR3-3]